jgi:hypothetical protein
MYFLSSVTLLNAGLTNFDRGSQEIYKITTVARRPVAAAQPKQQNVRPLVLSLWVEQSTHCPKLEGSNPATTLE